MNRLASTLAALAFALALPAHATSTYSIDAAHSEVGFTVRHLLSNVRGSFNDFSGTIVRNAAEPARSSVEFTIQAASIDTRHGKRDEHLRSADFFDVANHPTITFKSKSVERVAEGQYEVTGDLTMRGVTKVVTLPVTFAGEMKDPWGNVKSGFTTSIRLNRKDFGINWNQTLDSGGFLLSDEVEVGISLQAKKDA